MPANFTNGPAAPLILSIRRYPVLLRVVRDISVDPPKWDALDQLDDKAKETEQIYVYRLMEQPASCHIDGVRNGRRFGEWTQIGRYEVLPDVMIPDEILRNNETWKAWCNDNFAALCPAWAKDAVMP